VKKLHVHYTHTHTHTHPPTHPPTLGALSMRMHTLGESQHAPTKLARFWCRMSLIAFTSSLCCVVRCTMSLFNIFIATSIPFHLPWLRITFL